MRNTRKALLAAGLLAGTAALTGCTANTAPANTSTPQPAQQATAEPATAQPTAAATASPAAEEGEVPGEEKGEDSTAALALEADGKAIEPGAVMEQDSLLLPLEATAKALGFKTDSQQKQEDQEGTQVRRVITLDKEDSRITVAWTVSDNTAKNISWQKDGLLIPVDTRLTTIDGEVYVPAAFFEEAMGVTVSRTQKGIEVTAPKPMETNQITDDSSGKNG